MPVAFKMIDKYGIYDFQDARKTHTGKIGFLGGLVIFSSFYLSYGISFPSGYARPDFSHNLVMSLFAIFILGFADDFLNFNSNKKFIVQFFVSTIFMFKSELVIDFNQVISIIPDNYFINFILTIITISIIINSINLIDGSDGVAASIGILASAFFSILFITNNDVYFATLSLSLTGSLIGFLYYNKPNAKIYMGDSGSTFIGMILSIFMLRFLNNGTLLFNNINHLYLKVAFGLLSLPILDMIRVMVTRILKRTNPFSGDRNHLHHILADAGISKQFVIYFIISLNLFNLSLSFNDAQNLLFYVCTISFFYSLLIIGIKTYRTSRIDSVNKYSIHREHINTQIDQKAEQIHN